MSDERQEKTSDGSNSPTAESTRESIGIVLGRVASGVFVLTAGDGSGRETGMLASWVQQASFEPPMISVAVNQKRYLNEWLQRTGLVVLNLLEEKNKQLLKQFGAGYEPDEAAFADVQISRANNGLPVLAESMGYLAGRVRMHVAAGDHIVYLVEITEAGSSATLENGRPMIHVRRSGFRY